MAPHVNLETPRKTGRRALILGGAALAVGGAAAYRRLRSANGSSAATDDERAALGWGALEAPPQATVVATDGAELAVWDVGQLDAPPVVLAHGWSSSHAVWIPVARRLVEAGHRVVLYDQRGHGASELGSATITIELLAHDLESVLEQRDIKGAVLAGHSMGGMTVMSLATYRPDVLTARAKALVLVATAAANMSPIRVQRAQTAAATFISSPRITRLMASPNGYRFVRGVFGKDPVRSHLDLTAEDFAKSHAKARGGFMSAIAVMDLLRGIAAVDLPTTVMVGSRDRLTPSGRANEIVRTIPGARLVRLEDRGHMLPLEEPDTVADEILRALKG
jgi:non-heme chloroperoxidase